MNGEAFFLLLTITRVIHNVRHRIQAICCNGFHGYSDDRLECLITQKVQWKNGKCDGNIKWMRKKSVIFFFFYPFVSTSFHTLTRTPILPSLFYSTDSSLIFAQKLDWREREKIRELMKLLKSHLKCALLRTFAHRLHWLLWYLSMCVLNSHHMNDLQYQIHVLIISVCSPFMLLLHQQMIMKFHNKRRNECILRINF